MCGGGASVYMCMVLGWSLLRICVWMSMCVSILGSENKNVHPLYIYQGTVGRTGSVGHSEG